MFRQGKKIAKKLKKIRRTLAILAAITIAILGPIIWINLRYPKNSKAAWYNGDWAYRQRISFTSSSAVSNQKVKLDIDTATLISAGQLQSSCQDLRFTNIGGKTLTYYLDSAGGACNTNSTDVYVLFPNILASENIAFMYYGNPSATAGTQAAQFSESTLTPSAGPTFASSETTPGPIAYWKFDEGTGTSAQDGSANNNDGTLTNGPTWQSEDQCVSGKCLYFDGSNDVVTVSGTVAGIQSVSFWVKPLTTSEQLIDLNGSAYIQVSSGTISATGFTSPTIYVNGVVSSTLTANKWQFVEVTTGSTISGSAIKFAQISSNYGQVFLDEPKIYPYARSAAQVRADYLVGAAKIGSSVVLGDSGDKYLSDGLVGYWKMDESSANTCTGGTNDSCDSSGNANNGAWTGNAANTSGKYGSGVSFDGNADYIDVADNSLLNFGTATPFTLSIWFKKGLNDTVQVLLDKRIAETTGYVVYHNASNTITFKSSTGDNATITTTTAISDTNWHHYVFTDNRAGARNVYLDGQRDSSDTTDSSSVSISASTTLRFGRNSQSALGTYDFTGTLDEVRIYNRALSADEVRSLYNWAPGPVAYWKMDESSWNGTSGEVVDLSGNNNSGTRVGNATTTDGKYGNAGSFDGSGDYVSVSNSSTLNVTDSITITAWINATSTDGNIVNKNSANGYLFRQYGSGAGLNFAAAGSFNLCEFYTGISNGTWYHVAVTYDRTKCKIYLNGILRTSSAKTTAMNAGTGALQIGNSVAGSIDDVKIYNYARTPQQIVEDMNGSHPTGGSPVGSQVAYWKFDEQQGSTVNNSVSSNDFTETISGATWKTAENCKSNGCLDFDGSDDVLTITNATGIDLNDNLAAGLTVDTWIYADSDGEGDVGQIFQKGTNTYCRVDSQSGSNLDVECSLDLATSDATLNISSAITTGTWNHIVMSYTDDSDDEISIWINGKLRGTSTNGSGAPATESNNLLIGGTTTANFDGKIDEFKIYSTELTADQIRIDYNQGAGINFGSGASTEASTLSDGAGNPPVAQWNFDEKTGTTVNDTSGNANTGTLTNGPTWTTGKVGSALNFDGTDDYVSVADNSTLNVTTNFTFSAWIYWDTAASGNPVVYDSGTQAGHWYVGLNNNKLDFTENSITAYDANTTVTKDAWHYVTVVKSGDSGTNVTFYLDGKPDGTASVGTVTTPSGSKNIGRKSQPSNYFQGKIDNVSIYNYARTAAQVAYDYNRGKPIGHWKFDECQGTTANDASGNNNNGTITIGATGTQTTAGTCNTSSTAWGNGATGKMNYSLNFDGTDDYVDIGDMSSTESKSALTWSMWIKPNSTTNLLDCLLCKSKLNLETGWAIETGNINNSVLVAIPTTLTDGSTYGITSSVLTSGQWTHISAVFDGTQTGNSSRLKVYVNGVLQTLTFTGTIPSSTQATSSNVTIGSLSDQGGGRFFNGSIDDVKIYNYALSAAQVRQMMNDGAGARYGPSTGSP